MAKPGKHNKKEEAQQAKGINIKKKLTGILELPREIVMDLPLVSLVGQEEMTVENYRGIIEYSEERLRLNTQCGVMKIEGKNLFLKQITDDNISITGVIVRIEYL